MFSCLLYYVLSLSKLAIILSKTINISRFLLGLYSSIFLLISSISFDIIKALESFRCFNLVLSLLLIKNLYFASDGSLAYKYILSISGCWLIRLNNKFVFPDQEPPISNILYGWSGICGKFRLCYFRFSFVTSSKLMIFVLSYYIVRFSLFFHLLDLYSFHDHMFLLNQLIAFFYHHLNLRKSS